jgi:hypothetical protein
MNSGNKTLDFLLKKIGRVESVHKEKFTAEDSASVYFAFSLEKLKKKKD